MRPPPSYSNPPARRAACGAGPRFDRDLVRKYDRSGSRYTSYPTAHHFTDGFDGDPFAGLLERSAGADAPLSLQVRSSRTV